MHPISPALAAMVKRTSVQARLAASAPVDPAELERAIAHALREYALVRPRIVAFAPAVALKRVLALPGLRRRLERERQPDRVFAHRKPVLVAGR